MDLECSEFKNFFKELIALSLLHFSSIINSSKLLNIAIYFI